MLINFSNHSSGTWGKEQHCLAVLEYSSVIDVQFPAISVDADANEIKMLAREYVKRIKGLLAFSKDESDAVHVMGEHTFVFAFVELLKREKIPAIASVAKRNSVVTQDGVKHSRFSFAGFRNYFTVEGE